MQRWLNIKMIIVIQLKHMSKKKYYMNIPVQAEKASKKKKSIHTGNR